MTICESCSIDFHGLGIEAWAPEYLLNALAERFAEFPSGRLRPHELRFEFHLVEVEEQHQVQRPTAPSRPFYQTEEGEAAYFPSVDVCYLDYGGRVKVLCDPILGNCKVSVLRPESEQAWLATHPMFTLPLLEMLKRRGKYGIHAAGFARDGRSVLLPGSSGAGKSTLTLALLRAGYDFLGDDLVLLEPGERIEALAFPEPIDLTRNSMSLFPELLPLLGAGKRTGWPKYQLRASDLFSATVTWRTTPVAIVFPRIANAVGSLLMPLASDEAFLELSGSVFLTEKQSTQRCLATLADLTKNVPAYRMLTGRDLDNAVSVLGDLLK
jgi:hypothetical protein